MANLSMRRIVLYDNWPGSPDPNLGIPDDGFEATAAGHSCVTKPIYPPMTKIQAFQYGDDASACQGPYTMIYLAFHEMSGANALQAASPCTGAQPICAHIDATAWTDVGHYSDLSSAPYIVTNCSACMDVTSIGKVAIGCNPGMNTDTTTSAYKWGWFWCAGVCPHVDITHLDYDMTCTATAWNHVQPVVDTSQLVLGVGDASFEGVCGMATTVAA
ncbi:MAG: hypothetical protein ACYS6W_11740 [Planctomycetota bacterium]|jgi:hypothetical protein